MWMWGTLLHNGPLFVRKFSFIFPSQSVAPSALPAVRQPARLHLQEAPQRLPGQLRRRPRRPLLGPPTPGAELLLLQHGEAEAGALAGTLQAQPRPTTGTVDFDYRLTDRGGLTV